MPVIFPAAARFGLGVVVAALGYLIAGELIVDEQLRGAIAAGIALLASAGIVPPKPESLPAFLRDSRVGFGLTVLATGLTYAVTTISTIDLTVRGIIVALIALLASLGFVPPQSQVPRTLTPRA